MRFIVFMPFMFHPDGRQSRQASFFIHFRLRVRCYDSIETMLNERDFFTEKTEMKPMSLACPQCRHRADYQIKWVKRTKKDRIPSGADERDRALYAKLRDHLYRIDDYVNCARCRRRFEIPSHQSMVFL